MSLEDETAGAVVAIEESAPPEEPPVEGTLPEETPEDDAPPPEETEEQETYDTWLERVNASEILKAEHEARLDELRSTATKEGRQAAQARLQPMVQQRRDNARAAAEALTHIYGVIAKAASDGTLDQDTVNLAWQQNHQYVQKIIFAANDIGVVIGAKDFIAHALGGHRGERDGQAVWQVPKDALPLANKFLAEMDGVLEGRTTPQEVTQDFLDELMEARIAKAKAPLQAKISELKALLEKGKAGARDGQGVKVSATVAAGGRPTRAQYAAATSEQRAKWREAGIDPLT